jgi:hypothetical protein
MMSCLPAGPLAFTVLPQPLSRGASRVSSRLRLPARCASEQERA